MKSLEECFPVKNKKNSKSISFTKYSKILRKTASVSVIHLSMRKIPATKK